MTKRSLRRCNLILEILSHLEILYFLSGHFSSSLNWSSKSYNTVISYIFIESDKLLDMLLLENTIDGYKKIYECVNIHIITRTYSHTILYESRAQYARTTYRQ